MTEFSQRAISADQKALRRQQILKAAERLFETETFESISMSRVAKEAGVAKGTLYLYFSTKEALFLSLARETLAGWFERVRRQIERPTRLSKTALASTISRELERESLLPAYVSILHTVLEQNIDADDALSFKQFLKVEVTETGESIDARLRYPPGSGGKILLRLHALIIGLRHMAAPSPVVASILDRADMALFRVDMNSELRELIPLLIQPRR